MTRPPVRWSNLKWMGRSPAHYRYHLDHPTEPSQAMRIGAVVHSLVLGGPRSFAEWDGKVRRGKEWEAFRADHVGEEIVSAREFQRARAIAAAVRSHPEAMRLLKGAQEMPLRWQIGGRECAGTLDVLGEGYVTELKVTNDASPHRLPGHAVRMGWHGQLAWYGNGADLNGYPVRAYHIVAIEPEPPYALCCYRLTDRAVEAGRTLFAAHLNRLAVYEDSDEWPAYGDAVQELDVYDNDNLIFEEDAA
jgi:hypothetical protein